MKKRYISLIINLILIVSIVSYFGPKPINLVGCLFMLIVFLAALVFIIDLCLIISFNGDFTKRKIILNFKDLNKYLNIAPEKYDCSEVSKVYYMTGENFRYIHTSIHFDSIISNIRYFMNRNTVYTNKHMEQYLDSVAKDIEVYRVESQKKIEEAIDSQKEILNRMKKKEYDDNGISETLSI